MRFQIKIDCGTAALCGDSVSRNQEIANILIAVAADLLDQGLAPGDKLPLRDRNGHSVGIAQLSEPQMLASSAPQKLNGAGGGADCLRHTGGQVRPLHRDIIAKLASGSLRTPIRKEFLKSQDESFT